MPIGALPHRINVYRPPDPVGTQDDYGRPTETPRVVKRNWPCKIMAQGTREFWRAQRMNATMTHLVQMRYVKDLGRAWTLQFRGRTLNVLSVEDVEERNHEMLVTCEEAI